MKIKHSKKRVGYEIFLAVLCGCFVCLFGGFYGYSIFSVAKNSSI